MHDFYWDEENENALDDFIKVYDAFDGRLLAQKGFSSEVGLFADEQGRLYVSSSHSFMAFSGAYSFDKKNWEYAVGKVKEEEFPIIWADEKYVAADHRIFNAKTGKELTKLTKSNPQDDKLRFIDVTDGLFLRYFWGENDSDNIIELLDDTGKIVWSKRAYLFSFNDKFIYAAIYQKDKNAWSYQQFDLYSGKSVKTLASDEIEAGQDGYLAIGSGNVKAYNDKGKHLWTYKLPNPDKSTIVGTINHLYIKDDSGIITTILEEPDSTTSPSPKQK